MPEDGHLAWKVSYNEGDVFEARGIYDGRLRLTDRWPSLPEAVRVEFSSNEIRADGQDVLVLDIIAPDAELAVGVEGASVLGWGNGDPGFKYRERPVGDENIVLRPFNGCCQLLLRSIEGASGNVRISIGGQTFSIPYR